MPDPQMILRNVLHLLSPAGRSARLTVLIFHRVHALPDSLFPDEMDASRFDMTCGWIREWFNVLPLDKAASLLANGCLPARAAAITFDDGYADNCQVALPILKKHGLPATFFVATGFLNGGRMWNDTLIEAIRNCPRGSLELSGTPCEAIGKCELGTLSAKRAAVERLLRAVKYLSPGDRVEAVDAIARRAAVALPDDLMMTGQQVRQLHAAGMQIGAHTVNHPILSLLTENDASQEILTSKRTLESLVSSEVKLFAYPNGKPVADYNAESVRIVRQLGFLAAVSTSAGSACMGSDLYQIPRFTPWDRSRWRFGLRLARNLRQVDQNRRGQEPTQ